MRNTFFTSLSKESIFAILFAGIALVSLSFFFFPNPTKKTIEQKVAGSSITTAPTRLPLPTVTQKRNTATTTPQSVEENGQSSETQTIQITIAVTPTPAQQTTTDKATISVTIAGVSSFSIAVDKGKNQCDVLQKALQDGKISQLLMKYDSSLDSNGIYQINNLGKDNAVWWTYTINGKSPATGCNHIAANDGDTVSWNYIGSH